MLGREVWSIQAGMRTLSNGHAERVLIPSPVAYGAFADATGDEALRTPTPAAALRPGERYTIFVDHGGSGGFIGRRVVVRRGQATFTVAAPSGSRR